jgi:D-beta-D-heptose 7-phosphate kinase / D-beta-D-heptose 1-phosphate adenosyltransferase
MNSEVVEAIQHVNQKRILVIGEATTDIELAGTSHRVAREAPVPIVQVTQTLRVPGRAANTAVNVARLGAATTFLTVVGDDEEGERLRDMLEKHHVDISHFVVERGRHTQTVQRLAAGGQLLVRFDTGTSDGLSRQGEIRLIQKLRKLFVQYDAVLISDYGYGVVSDAVIAAIAELQRRHHKLLIIDSKHLDRYQTVGATVVKPNYQEALALAGITQPQPVGKRAAQLAAYRDTLLAVTGAGSAVVTLDKEGSVVLRKGLDETYRTYSQPLEHARAVGAGDTFSAALTIGLATGLPLPVATELAQAAAAVVIHKTGTVSCSQDELMRYVSADPKLITDRQELAAMTQGWRDQGKRIIFTNGCFDILHSGHVSYLNQARAQGDVLIVGLNSDASVSRLKGPERPVNPLTDRARVLSGLSAVDVIVPFEEDTPHNLISIVRPHIFVKGGDYTRDTLPEASLVERLGGEVAIMPFAIDRSTTNLIARIRTVAM